MVELAAVPLKLAASVEDLAERILDDGNLVADSEPSPKPFLDIGGRRKMISMHMLLENPVEPELPRLDIGDQPICRSSVCATGGCVVVENRIDDCALLRCGIAHHVAHGIGRFVEETLYEWV